MVFGELVPKNLAIARPLTTARAVAGFQVRFSGTVPLADPGPERLGELAGAQARRRACRGAAVRPLPAGAGLAGPLQRRGRHARPRHRDAAGPVAAVRRTHRRRADDPARAGAGVACGRERARPDRTRAHHRLLPVPRARRRPRRGPRHRARQAGLRGARAAAGDHAGVLAGPTGADRSGVPGRRHAAGTAARLRVPARDRGRRVRRHGGPRDAGGPRRGDRRRRPRRARPRRDQPGPPARPRQLAGLGPAARRRAGRRDRVPDARRRLRDAGRARPRTAGPHPRGQRRDPRSTAGASP